MTETRAVQRARSKYGARKTVVDGITFDSKREAERYRELVLMQAAGEISALQCQVPFLLHACEPVDGRAVVIGKYVADFVYSTPDLDTWHVEDAKGFRTPLYKWKRKHFEVEYGFVIEEI